MTPTSDGTGYWLVASDGGIFDDYGDAGFYGSAGSIHLNQPVVGMSVSSDGQGYTLVASDGGVFTYGDARFLGSIPGVLAPGQRLNEPIEGIVTTPDGGGYWMVASDGGIFKIAMLCSSDPWAASTRPLRSLACSPMATVTRSSLRTVPFPLHLGSGDEVRGSDSASSMHYRLTGHPAQRSSVSFGLPFLHCGKKSSVSARSRCSPMPRRPPHNVSR